MPSKIYTIIAPYSCTIAQERLVHPPKKGALIRKSYPSPVGDLACDGYNLIIRPLLEDSMGLLGNEHMHKCVLCAILKAWDMELPALP
jgi:hypothetical protein